MKQDLVNYMQGVGSAARDASRVLAAASSASKSQALQAVAKALDGSRKEIIAANGKDMQAAEGNHP